MLEKATLRRRYKGKDIGSFNPKASEFEYQLRIEKESERRRNQSHQLT
jgi:hypothetical protein